MEDFDPFKPYSLETRGDLKKYLRDYDGTMADNMFFGEKYFFVMREQGFLIPFLTTLRVDRSPVPDLVYFVNEDFMLESRGTTAHNMSAVGAKKGIYNPRKVLHKVIWSIHGLKLEGTLMKRFEFF